MKHSESVAGIRISYWQHTNSESMVASDKGDADTVVVGECYPSFKFKLPEQEHDFRNLCAALELAAANGDTNARREIRRSLGISDRNLI